jgi:hypothetical protein
MRFYEEDIIMMIHVKEGFKLEDRLEQGHWRSKGQHTGEGQILSPLARFTAKFAASGNSRSGTFTMKFGQIMRDEQKSCLVGAQIEMFDFFVGKSEPARVPSLPRVVPADEWAHAL